MKNNFLLLLLFGVGLSNLPAQTKHILHGYLLDEQGHPISGIRLEAIQSLNIFSESDKNGHFQFSVPDLGSQDLKVKILTNQYALYNNADIAQNKNTAIISAEKQKEGIVNVFMIAVAHSKNRGRQEQPKSLSILNEYENETQYQTDYPPISQPISLAYKINNNINIDNTRKYQAPIISNDSPIIKIPIVSTRENTEINSPITERGISSETSKSYEVQIASISQDNPNVKTRYEQLTKKEIKTRNKNGRFVYTIPVASAQEARELINTLSTPEMEKEGIKQPFMIVIAAEVKAQTTAVTSNSELKTKPVIDIGIMPEDVSSETNIPLPAPKVYPIPKAPTPPTTSSKHQYIIQLQSSRFPMNSVAKRMLEADLSKIDEELYEYNDPNADIKYRYYVMRKYDTLGEAEALRAKLITAGIESLILTDKMNVVFK